MSPSSRTRSLLHPGQSLFPSPFCTTSTVCKFFPIESHTKKLIRRNEPVAQGPRVSPGTPPSLQGAPLLPPASLAVGSGREVSPCGGLWWGREMGVKRCQALTHTKVDMGRQPGKVLHPRTPWGGLSARGGTESPIPNPQLVQGVLSSGSGCSIVPGWGCARGCWARLGAPRLPHGPRRHGRVVAGGGRRWKRLEPLGDRAGAKPSWGSTGTSCGGATAPGGSKKPERRAERMVY